MKNGITAFKVKVTSKSKHRCLSRWYLLNHQVFCYQTWYCDASSWAGVSCKKICLPFSRSSSQQGPVWSKYDSFYCIFWTADLFATKFGLIVHYHKPECFIRNWIVMLRVKVTDSKCQWLFIQMLSSEMLNLILPNLVRWCIIMSQIVFQKIWFAVFKVKVTVKVHVTKDDFLIYLLNCWSFLQLNLVWWHLTMSWIVM